MILVILTAILAVSNAATLGETNEQPRHARKAYGLFHPFRSSNHRSFVHSDGYRDGGQGVVVDAASTDTWTSGVRITGHGGSRDSYGHSFTSTAHKTIEGIGSGLASFLGGGGGSKKGITTGTEYVKKVTYVEVDDDTTATPTVVTGIDLRNLRFPLYIQDFASQYDIRKYYEGFAEGHVIFVGKYGIIINTNDGYLYKGDDGKIYNIKYIIDEDEYKEEGGNSPNQFSIPDEILKVVKDIPEKGDPGTSLHFPIFIQDFGSEYDSRTYYYGLAKGSGISIGQNGVIIKIDGGYLYKGGNGKIYIVKYIRNENELNEKGNNLPTQFSIPSEILKVLKEITAKETTGISSLAKTIIEYPVYVQDFADEFDKKVYYYGLAKGTGISIGHKGVIVKIYGGYLYKGDDEKIYIVKYIINESELRRKGGTLEIQFSIPVEILKVLKETTEKEAAGDSGIVQTNIKFPVYIQDYVGEFYIQKYYEGLVKGSGIPFGQKGVIIKTDDGYLYKGVDGKIYIVKYILNENEFKEKGNSLEEQFSIPGEVLEVLSQINIQFPVYIQDYASELEIVKYYYGLAIGSGISADQKSVIIKTDSGYLYKGNDKKIYIVKYVINENEYKDKGNNLKFKFLIPGEILKVLKEITEKEAVGKVTVAETNIQFPIYIQDFASKLDVKKYYYGLARGSGISIGRKGIIIKTNEGFLYKGDDGKIYIVRYITDEKELMEKRSTLENQFSIPRETIKVLKKNTEKEAASNSVIAQINIEFPVYFQDFASVFDIQKYYESLAKGSGISIAQNKYIIKIDDGYLYKGDDGKIYIVKYIFDENKLTETESSLDTQFMIPDEVLEVLFQINIQFPVYIQDNASGYDKLKYFYGLAIGGGISISPKGVIIKTNDGYLYKGDDGKIYIVRYIINENELKEKESKLPTRFRIPGEILKVLREITERESTGKLGIVQTNIQFPVYIQDYASKFDEKKYYYGLARNSGITFGHKGVIIKTNEGYLYKGDDGKIYIVRYIIDENELRKKGSTLENQFEIPEEYLKVIKEIFQKDTTITQINIKFPVYIQDFANVFDIQKYYEGLAKGSGISIDQNKIIIKIDDGYLYKGDDERIYIVKYIVDENKLRETESSLDTQFLIPDEVLKVLVQINIQFPIYIQDIASEYDKIKYFYGLATDGGIPIGHKGVIIKTDGGYLYKGDDGKIYIVRYIVNENEFKEKASNLPTRFSIPGDILNVLKESTTREAAGQLVIVQTNIQFPVYVQDLASKYDEKKYYYGLARGSGISIGQNFIIIKTNGGYLYKNDDGKIYIIRYIVNENELREKGSTLENPFAIPGETLKVVKEITQKYTANNSAIPQTNIKFPVFIQDFASEFYIHKYYEGLAKGSDIPIVKNKIIIKIDDGYLYKGDDEKIYIVKYVIDENKLKEIYSTLDTQFLIPDDILEVLFRINIHFPVYVQDLASEYDKIKYFYGLASNDGISIGQKGIIIKISDGYLYKGDDGKIYIVRYIINQYELKNKESNLPNPFSIPEEILKVLKESIENETTGNLVIGKTKIKYPVYIQDLASKFDEKRYYYGFARGNGISVGQKDVIIQTNGGYLYKGDDGKVYIVRHIFSKRDMGEKGSSLENQFLIPQETLKVIKDITQKEAAGNFAIAPINIKFPVYIQNFASVFDIQKYNEGLAKGNGISTDQNKIIIKIDEGYLYKGDDGKIYIVKYVIDENKLAEIESSLDTQFLIPDEISEVLAQINIQFPVYVQDIASEYDKKKYFYGLATGSGISIGQKVIIIKTDGGYLYKGEDGKIYIVRYIVNENELKEKASSLPTRFSIPGEILRVLRVSTEQGTAGNFQILETKIKFPVYIQDFASELDVKKYYYGLARGSGISFSHKRVVIKTNGGYLYKGDDDKIYIVRYIFNENELKEKSSTFENQFSIPGEILTVLKEIAAKEATGDTSIAQINIEFPLYIQDFASELDIRKYYEGLSEGSGISMGQRVIIIKTNRGYLYKGDDGKIYIIRYIIDEKEFSEKQSTLETQFSIPDEILAAVKDVTAKEINVSSVTGKEKQVVASEPDKKKYFDSLAKGNFVSIGRRGIGVETEGGYLYQDSDGIIYFIQYTTIKNELNNQGTQNSIPDEILNAIVQMTKKEVTASTNVFYKQELANEAYMKEYFNGLAKGDAVFIGQKFSIVRTKGGYLYKGADGYIYVVKYTTDKNEFKPQKSQYGQETVVHVYNEKSNQR